VNAFLYSTVIVGELRIWLNPGDGKPFGVVQLADGSHATVTMHTPAEARALAAAFEGAALLLEEHAARTAQAVTP
jgi:hypothetical protein